MQNKVICADIFFYKRLHAVSCIWQDYWLSWYRFVYLAWRDLLANQAAVYRQVSKNSQKPRPTEKSTNLGSAYTKRRFRSSYIKFNRWWKLIEGLWIKKNIITTEREGRSQELHFDLWISQCFCWLLHLVLSLSL